ncbi:MAG: two-component system activity regulator YycH [Anaerovoracaceae bacterium]|jgi:regulatory protein YycH of two-component signal transduction system YycFG
MGKPKQHIEFIKNILLVVLFLTTMLLLYFFWSNPVTGFRLADIIGEEPQEIPSYEQVIQPGKIVVHFESGGYTVLKEEDYNAWGQCLRLLQDLDRQEIRAVEEITGVQFAQIMDFRSILYQFYYDLPLESFVRLYGIPEIAGDDQIGDFSAIGFSSGSPESLFLYSNSKDKYYRIVYGQPHTSMDEMLSSVEAATNVNYHRIGTLVGTENQTLVPLSLDVQLEEIPFTPEFEDLNTPEVKDFAKTFFGESFDFVRKIEESKGTHIYMYGYGDKVLTISAGGRVEYKNKETPQGSQQNYFEALDTAIQFVASHGGWKTEEGMAMNPFVRYVQHVESNKRKGYRIVFGMELSEDELYLEGSSSIAVEVIHGQVTQYLRDMVWVDEEDYLENTNGTRQETFSTINMIAQNYPYIASILAEEGHDFGGLQGDELFNVVADLIYSVDTGYMKPEYEGREDDVLIPAWIVKAGTVMIYFDLYNAQPLGYTNLSRF